MKKHRLIAVMIVSLMLVASCGKEESQTAVNESVDSSQEEIFESNEITTTEASEEGFYQYSIWNNSLKLNAPTGFYVNTNSSTSKFIYLSNVEGTAIMVDRVIELDNFYDPEIGKWQNAYGVPLEDSTDIETPYGTATILRGKSSEYGYVANVFLNYNNMDWLIDILRCPESVEQIEQIVNEMFTPKAEETPDFLGNIEVDISNKGYNYVLSERERDDSGEYQIIPVFGFNYDIEGGKVSTGGTSSVDGVEGTEVVEEYYISDESTKTLNGVLYIELPRVNMTYLKYFLDTGSVPEDTDFHDRKLISLKEMETVDTFYGPMPIVFEVREKDGEYYGEEYILVKVNGKEVMIRYYYYGEAGSAKDTEPEYRGGLKEWLPDMLQ